MLYFIRRFEISNSACIEYYFSVAKLVSMLNNLSLITLLGFTKRAMSSIFACAEA